MTSKLKILVLLAGFLLPVLSRAQGCSLRGTVTDRSSGEPVEFASVVIEASEQWAMADAKGRFCISGIELRKGTVTVSCLGYVDCTRELEFKGDIENLQIALTPDNLTLESAMVTAKENASSATTSRIIDRTALDHVQLMNVTDISSLLPGGATSGVPLTTEQQFNVRSSSAEGGNASFGTAVEVDGVRLSENASFTNMSSSGSFKGVSTNSIASSNIESVEVISGVPSVEYGDMSSGVVKIHTRRGRTPLSFTMSTGPNTKQVSLSKGFSLGRGGKERGVVNAGAESTRSIAEPMSPYTSYTRNQLSLNWNRQIGSSMPLRLGAALTANMGGLDNRADPDKLTDTFLTRRENGLRASLSASWLLSKSWITNLELTASASYADRLEREKAIYHSAVTSTSLHATQAGYYMAAPYSEGGENPAVSIPAGSWYNVMAMDDKPFSAKAQLKAVRARSIGAVNSKLKAGADWSLDKNFGIGRYSEDPATAPSCREWRFREVPAMTNLAVFLEESLLMSTGDDSRLHLVAGLRWDNTIVPSSAYGITSSLSPRFNARYTFFTQKSRSASLLRELSVRASWGVAVKQPSFAVLYPAPSYYDTPVFISTADADNSVSRAYFVMPRVLEYNPALLWQRTRQGELGLDFNLAGNKLSLAAFCTRSFHSYAIRQEYDRFTYTYTPLESVQGMAIPAADRLFSISSSDGTVTVSDRNGLLPSILLPGEQRKQFVSHSYEDNDDSPVTRYGLEWVIDFAKIRPLNTSIRLDGTWYSYRSLTSDMVAWSPVSQTSYDRTPYKYVGYYYGGNSLSNGRQTSMLRTNVSFVTNIPEARMILSLKLESCLLNYSRSLSERADGAARSRVLSSRDDLLSDSGASVYDSECYTALFPDWYSSFDNPEPQPFLDAFLKARENNPELYSDLSKLVVAGTTYSYTFLKDYISPYFSANLSVTKEIGELASISFYANNFFNNLSQVYSTRTGTFSSVSQYIPRFHYGLTLRIKL